MLLLPKFDYHEPENMRSALELMSSLKSNAKIIAGGTDILVNMKKGVISPKYLVSLGKMKELFVLEQRKKGIAIGSHVIISELAESGLLWKNFSVIAKAASVLGSPLIRNRATIGGNIVTARPAADLPPALMAVGAKVELKGKKGRREVSLDEFFLGPGKTVIRADEILTKIIINELPPFTGGDYMKLGHRKALEIAIVAVAARVTLDKPQGIIKNVRIILSAVAPQAIHAVSAEKVLINEKPTEKLIERAATLAMQDCSPITDIRGGAEYRKEIVKVLTKRTLLNAVKAVNRKKV
ncbi:MAG TPA: xanthine dehydrogenase family protein subunit M, partial [Syntrophorhabdaceae bacterium]|nr:xanthine dehydrogenase family protein subunit M [Syntrophorhabdaceae bacterium]